MAHYKILNEQGELVVWRSYLPTMTKKGKFSLGKKSTTRYEFGKKRLEEAVVSFVRIVNRSLYSNSTFTLMSGDKVIAYSKYAYKGDGYDRWRIHWTAPKPEMDQIYAIIKNRKLGLRKS